MTVGSGMLFIGYAARHRPGRRALVAEAHCGDIPPIASHSPGRCGGRPGFSLIPGTSSIAHLRENVAGAALELPGDATAEIDGILR